MPLLIKHGADTNDKYSDGQSLLSKSIKTRHVKKAKILIKGGADVNYKNQKGETPLMCAAGLGFKDVVKYLIKYGAKTKSSIRTKNCIVCSEEFSLSTRSDCCIYKTFTCDRCCALCKNCLHCQKEPGSLFVLKN